ncbi:Transcriptional regulator DauR [invertebrate metagenome]|uniref:Transcriptional regulator DauR n=1 Tax=invertebrate metagenome TaxID=1711999 RepID=A0A2H9T5N0_9ZZZZ
MDSITPLSNGVGSALLSDIDKQLLTSYFALADSIADLIGPHCEVVIHSLGSLEQSVVKIVNGHHTGRKVGYPMTDLGLKMLQRFERTGNTTPKSYFTKNKDGSLLKSTTCVLSGEHGQPIGLFCVNMNLSQPFPEIIKTLIPLPDETNDPVQENFSNCSSHIIEQAINQALKEVEQDSSVNLKSRKKTVTKRLFDNGIFEFKEAVTLVAEQLGITRHAIYKYLREFKS